MKQTFCYFLMMILSAMCAFGDDLCLSKLHADLKNPEISKHLKQLTPKDICFENITFKDEISKNSKLEKGKWTEEHFRIFFSNGKRKISFIKSDLSQVQILKFLHIDATTTSLVEKLGSPLGKRADYMGNLLRETWNIYSPSNGDEYFIITGYFLPVSEKSNERKWLLKGYSILHGNVISKQ